MIEMDSNHFQVIEESIHGSRAVDEQTFASLEILRERLERLKKLDGMFCGVEFSPAVKKLWQHKSTVAVG